MGICAPLAGTDGRQSGAAPSYVRQLCAIETKHAAGMCQLGALPIRRRLRWLESGLPQHHDDIGHRRTTAEFGCRLHRGNLAVGVAANDGMNGGGHRSLGAETPAFRNGEEALAFLFDVYA